MKLPGLSRMSRILIFGAKTPPLILRLIITTNKDRDQNVLLKKTGPYQKKETNGSLQRVVSHLHSIYNHTFFLLSRDSRFRTVIINFTV